MIRSNMMSSLVVALMLLSTVSAAQPESESSDRTDNMPVTRDNEQNQRDLKMEHMADAMASMAQMCEAMIEREMAGYPLKMAVLVGMGTVGAIALVLFVVLEIQWIRLVGLRICPAKRELSEKAS